MSHSLYIFEGVDGTGKTSTAKLFAKEINGEYYKGLPKKLRPFKNFVDKRLPAQFRYWFYSLGNRIAYREIIKLLQSSDVVVDQYIYCTIAFHTVSLNKKLKEPIPGIIPEYIVYLNASWSEIDRRLNERGERKHLEELGYLQKVDKVYTGLFRNLRNVIYLDTEKGNVKENVDYLINRIFTS